MITLILFFHVLRILLFFIVFIIRDKSCHGYKSLAKLFIWYDKFVQRRITMFCPNCGKPIEKENSKYCSYCGKPLRLFADEKKDTSTIEIHFEELKPIFSVLLHPMEKLAFNQFVSVFILFLSGLLMWWCFQYINFTDHQLFLLFVSFLVVFASYAINTLFLQFFGKTKYNSTELVSTLTYLHVIPCFALLLIDLCGLMPLGFLMMIIGMIGYFVYLFQLLSLLKDSFRSYLGALLLVAGILALMVIIYISNPSLIPTSL